MRLKICCFLLIIAISPETMAQSAWFLNFTPGVSYAPPVPLNVKQEKFPQISIRAHYKTMPLKAPLYYSARIGFVRQNHGWEAELNHLKIYLKNKLAEIQHFSVSHGYNQLFINRIKVGQSFGSKLGFGFVIAHPENTVRNMELNQKLGLFESGYYLSGPAIQYGIFKELAITKRFYILLESSATFAYAKIPIHKGKANTPVFGLHLKAGPGYFFIQPKTF